MGAMSRRTVVRSVAQTMLVPVVAATGGSADANVCNAGTSAFCSLLAQYHLLEVAYKGSPFDISHEEEDRLYRAWTDVCSQLKAAPIASDHDVVEAIRLIDSRIAEDETVGDLDRAVIRSVRLFLESKAILPA